MRISVLPLALTAIALFSPALEAAQIVGLTVGNQILRFDSTNPGLTSAPLAVTGLNVGHQLLGIDFRPLDGALVGVSRNGAGEAQAYTIDVNTGTAVAFGNLFSVLPGSTFGIDFNPVPNALRIVTDGEANLRLPMGGAGAQQNDTPLTRTSGQADPDLRVVSAAYSNNLPGGLNGATTLYAIDATTGALYNQGILNFAAPTPAAEGPNGGLLTIIGSLNLGTNLGDHIGFDISRAGDAFVSAVTAQGNQFFTLDVATGATNLVGNIGGPNLIRDIAAAPENIPEPSTFALAAIALLGLACSSRRRR